MSTATATAQTNEIAAQWRLARQIYPVYAAAIRQHGVALEPSRDLEYPVDRNEPEAIARVQEWFASADKKVEVWHLRQVLQTSEVSTEPVLRALVARFLEQEERSDSDRDKVDFLLAQYFFQCAPAKLHQTEPTLDDVAEVLEPVLGESIPEAPSWLAPLDEVLAELKQCESLSDMLERNLLARARKLKTESGPKFFGSSALLTFTRFNILVRGAFVRLIQGDLHAIRFALHALEQRGQAMFDCSSVGLGKQETSDHLRQFCHEWKALFRRQYSSGQSFQQLIKLRELLEAALEAPAPVVAEAEPEPQPEPVAESKPDPAPAPAEVQAEEPVADAKRPPVPPIVQVEVAAAYTAPAKPAPVKIGSKPLPPQPKAVAAPTDVDGCLELIAEQLFRDSAKKSTAVTAVTVAGHKLMLSSWEVTAFVEGGDDVSDALQRAVAARALLSRAVEERKAGKPLDAGPMLAAAHQEAAALQAQIAHAKEKKNIDGAVNLAASARRLIGLMEEMEHGPKPPQRSAQ